MIGQTLGHYRIVEKLGEGGMGVVYRARDEHLNRDIAIKVLPEAFARDRERLARFSREAQLLASLNHPNIAAIYGLEEQDGLRYLVLEYVPGQTLTERVGAGFKPAPTVDKPTGGHVGAGFKPALAGLKPARPPLPLDEALEICKQIAEALEAAHEKGIIHRDLKPANVKVTPEGKVKVLDFGLAKALEPEGSAADLSKSPTISAAATRAGVILGTAVYMSPEQARGKAVDKRTDIWAFGCVLYECLSGKQAFSGDSVTDILAAIVKGEPDWSALPAETSAQVRALLRRCLQKDLRERLRDAGDALLELEEALAAPPAPAPTAPIHLGLVSRPWKWALACAALLLAALAGAFLARWRWQPPAQAPRAPVRFSLPLAAKELRATGWSPSLAFSPDGSRLVYVVNRAGTTELVVRSLDRLEAMPIAGTEGAIGPFFSPDGQWVGFSAQDRLKKVPLNGGAPVVIADKPSAFGSAWAPDGAILLTPSFTEGIWRVPASGGPAQPFISPDRAKGERNCWFPEILPDGKSVLFTIRRTEPGDDLLAIQSLSGGERRAVTTEGTHGRYLPTGHLVYTRSGRVVALPFDLSRMEPTGPPTPILDGVATSPAGVAHFAFSLLGAMAYVPAGKTGGGSTLVWVDRKGKEQPLLTRPRAYLEPRLSPDGRRLAVEITALTHDLWVYELERETLTRLTFNGDSHGAIWAPDGKRLTFRSGAPGAIFWKAADGSGGAEQIIKGESRQYPDSWSPDGRILLFGETRPSSRRDILVLDMAAGRKAQPLVHTPFNETLSAFSPDGRWLTYVSDESGRPEVYVQPFPGPGGKWQVSADGGTQPVWARSGRELFYRSGDKMLAVAIVTRPSFAAGKPQVLFEASYEAGITGRLNYDVTPDGSRFVMVKGETESAAAQLNVVLHWFEELKGRATPGPKQ